MREYTFTDGGLGPLRFIAAYLEVLKDDDPVLHEKICAKHREMMKGIDPDSRAGPRIIDFIKDILKEAHEKRFYQAEEMINSDHE